MKALLEPLAAKSARWAADNTAAMKGIRPELPEGLSGALGRYTSESAIRLTVRRSNWTALPCVSINGHSGNDGAKMDALIRSNTTMIEP